ncbi:MAG: hypothetical protein JXR30_01675 [Alphaproteobacteria bacterium]|nr:hypothetical protein [Alphaproteobacteria bacterium]
MKAKKSAEDTHIQCEILTKNGNIIKSRVRKRLTKDGLLSVKFHHRAKSLDGAKMKTKLSRMGNTWDPELTIEDISPKFPPKWKFWLLKK